MMRFAMRLAVMVLAGMVIFSSGKGPWDKDSCSVSHGGIATVKRIVQGGCAILSPASAEAAVTKKSSQQTRPRLLTATHKKKAKSAALGKSKVKAFAKRSPKTNASVAKKAHAKAKHSGPGTTARASRNNKIAGTRCEPQSLTYARQRSGVMSARTGSENGPLTWYASEKRLGKTSGKPVPGSVLILGASKGHGMSTGHVAYVEKATPTGPSTYKITFSHTNYDRKCSLETNIDALYNSSSMTLDIFSGAWQAWGSGLRVAGFIQK